MLEKDANNLVVNLDKKKIMDPRNLTYSGESSTLDLAIAIEKFGNPFQLEFFHLLMDEWKGDRITLVEDSQEARDYLVQVEKYTYHTKFQYKLRRRVRRSGRLVNIQIEPKEHLCWKRRWDEFINQYVLINYDVNLFMTIDKRLFKQTRMFMPYFHLAKAEEKSEQGGSWSAHRIGVEPIGTPTLEKDVYYEMFRLIGDQSAIKLSMEDTERKLGLRD